MAQLQIRCDAETGDEAGQRGRGEGRGREEPGGDGGGLARWEEPRRERRAWGEADMRFGDKMERDIMGV